MKINYFVDRIKINKLNDFNHITINGWAISENGDIPNYNLIVNGNTTKFEMVAIPRPDVSSKYKFGTSSLQCGYIINLNISESIESIKINAKVLDTQQEILNLDKKKIDEISVNDTIEYAIDGVGYNETSNTITVNGWAVSYYKEKIDFKILNNEKQELDSVIRKTNREDLYQLKIVEKNEKYSGFMITFNGDNEQKYFLEISSDSFNKVIDLSEVNKVSKTAWIKNYIKAVNTTNLKKGLKYLKNHGILEFLQRVKQGPKGYQPTYDDWFNIHRVSEVDLRNQKETKFDYNPKISIIVPTYNTPKKYLIEMLDSVINQSYSNWELCIADGSSKGHQATKIILDYSSKDARIKLVHLEKNYGISGNTNKALELATGEYVGLFDHDDLLTPDVLYEVVLSLQYNRHDIVYTDEDKLDSKTNKFVDPNLKPDFSIDLFRSHNYITHFFVVKRDIINEVGGFRSEFDGAQDYDVMFRCIEKSTSVYHIPKVLYHWRMHAASTAENPESKLYCYEAGKKAIEEHLARLNVPAKVEMMPKPLWGMYHVTYETPGNPLVSIIIPNMEHKDVLKTCIDSLLNVNSYSNIEIIIVENNSTSKEIFDYYQELERYDNIKVVKWKKEFNYSALNNYGVKHASGDYYLFLNNDTELIEPKAISEMLGICMRDEVGIVGAKLLYEDDTVQHAGVVVGFGGYAGHVFNGIKKDDYGYMVRARINCNYSAVTAACMLVDKHCFEQVNGFDEGFRVSCNDIDFCLRVRKLNKLVVYNAFSLWYHYESKSRGYEDDMEKIKRFESEIKRFQERWQDILTNGDPYYNKNYKIEHGPFVLR